MARRKDAVFNFNGLFTACETTDQYPGELGNIVYDNATDAWYQRVRLSATAGDSDTTPVAVNNIARWKSKATYTICSDYAVAEAAQNSVAGIFISVPTAGQYCWIKKGGKASVANDGTAAVGGVVVDDATDNGTTTTIAAGTAPTCIPVGVVTSVSSPASSTVPTVRLTLMR